MKTLRVQTKMGPTLEYEIESDSSLQGMQEGILGVIGFVSKYHEIETDGGVIRTLISREKVSAAIPLENIIYYEILEDE